MSNSIWDATLPEDAGGYKVAKPGKYTFQVEKVTAKEFNPKPTSKIRSKCAEIDLQLRVETPDGDVTVFDRLYSDPSTIWKMTAFAKSIGVFKSGMTPGMLMRQCQDGIGQVEVGVREYNGKEQNEVKGYIAKEDPTDGTDNLPF